MLVNTAHNPFIETYSLTGEDSPVRSVRTVIDDVIKSISVHANEKPKKQNVRRELLNALYELYLSECNKLYRISNKKRCYVFIKLHYPGALTKKEEYYKCKDLFRKAKLPPEYRYLTPYKESDFQWYKRFNKTSQDDLREMISTAKDKIHRKENTIAYILAAGKTVDKPIDLS